MDRPTLAPRQWRSPSHRCTSRATTWLALLLLTLHHRVRAVRVALQPEGALAASVSTDEPLGTGVPASHAEQPEHFVEPCVVVEPRDATRPGPSCFAPGYLGISIDHYSRPRLSTRKPTTTGPDTNLARETRGPAKPARSGLHPEALQEPRPSQSSILPLHDPHIYSAFEDAACRNSECGSARLPTRVSSSQCVVRPIPTTRRSDSMSETKRVVVHVAGTGKTVKLAILPGATVDQVLEAVGVGAGVGYLLWHRDRPEPLRGAVEVYARVTDGDVLFAVADASCWLVGPQRSLAEPQPQDCFKSTKSTLTLTPGDRALGGSAPRKQETEP